MTYSEAIEWIYSTQNFGIKLGLDAPAELLAQFLAFPTRTTKVIHVAGTNGKGSTCALIDSLARSHGMRTGLFTSPHLVDFRERFQVQGEMISEEETASYLTQIRNLVSDWEHHPTFFEIALALGMKFFRDKECELIVLETGMGGRLDATTAVPADLYVLTPIAMDHAQWLGNTIAEVAGEKAGIIVSDMPVVSSKQDKVASRVIAEKANRMRSPLTVVTEPVEVYGVGLAGAHQRENAALALEALHQLGVEMRYDSVKDGLANVEWPGRFEVTSEAPLTVIDGAHNPQAAEILVRTWRGQYGEVKPIVIFGAIESKDLDGVLDYVSGLAEKIIFTPVDSPRTVDFGDIAKVEALENKELLRASDVKDALNIASKENLPILITGSLYLLGEYKSLIRCEKRRPTSQ
ncbi:MAG: bifunctional folylpolyglutamate synthase/dihydrofolate synthase [Akkermansiaceae bacterium]